MISEAEVQRLRREGLEVRRPKQREWMLNIAALQGRHWLGYSEYTARLTKVSPPGLNARLGTNLVLPRVAIQYAKIASQQPRSRTVPVTTHPDDVAKASACDLAIRYWWHAYSYAEAYRKALLWCLVTSVGYVKNLWQPDAGPYLTVAGQSYAAGAPLVDYCSPFELVYDPHARSIREARWVYQERLYPPEYVKERFGIERPPKESAPHLDLNPDPSHSGLRRARVESCRVGEFWAVPTKSMPEGCYVALVGGKFAHEPQPNPYRNVCPHPFDEIVAVPIPGEREGTSIVSGIRPVNVAYNYLRSACQDNLSRLSNPIVMAQAETFSEAPELRPGEINIIKLAAFASMKPEQLHIEPFPQAAFNWLKGLAAEADDQAGISEVSRGKIPRGARSEDMMAGLVQQEDLRVAPIAEQYEQLISRSLSVALRMAREFLGLPVVLRLTGAEKSYAAGLFRARDIPAEADVRVEPGTSLPYTAQVLQREAYALYDRGILKDPRHLIRMTRFGRMDEVVADMELDEAQAQRENRRMLQGQEVEVEAWHNHGLHLQVHNHLRKTVEYENASGEAKKAFRLHTTAHEQLTSQIPPPETAQLKTLAGGPGGRLSVGGDL